MPLLCAMWASALRGLPGFVGFGGVEVTATAPHTRFASYPFWIHCANRTGAPVSEAGQVVGADVRPVGIHSGSDSSESLGVNRLPHASR